MNEDMTIEKAERRLNTFADARARKNNVIKKLLRIHQSSGMHWVGNGFPVRSVFDSTFLVLSGEVVVNGERDAREGDLAIFARAGDSIAVKAKTDAKLLVMDGEPIAEPVVGHGPFVMNSRAQIQQAFEDYQLGRMGEID